MTTKEEVLQYVSLEDVASRYSEIKRIGKELVTLCPWHDDTKPSLTIYRSPKGYQLCKCFACGAGGNVIDYYMQQTGQDFKPSLDELARGALLGASDEPMIASQKPIKPAEWMATKPPNGNVPKFTHYELGEPVSTWAYKDMLGEVLYYECRYETTDEDGVVTKHPRPLTWGRLSKNTPYKWSPRHWGAPRPIFGLDNIGKYPPTASIVVFEGPRKAELADSLIKVPCCAWAAGARAWHLSDFSIMKGRNVILFPDNDEPGKDSMQLLAKHLTQIGAKVSIVTIPADKPEKWDICDDKDLTADTLKAYIKTRTEYKYMQATQAAAEAKAVIKKASKFVLDTSKVLHDDGYLGVAIKEPELVGELTGEPPIDVYVELAGQTDEELGIDPPTCDDGEYGAEEPNVPVVGAVKQLPPTFQPMMKKPAGATTDVDELPDPVDLLTSEINSGIFRADMIPALGELITLKAANLGTDAGGLALCMLATLAAAIDDRIKIKVETHGDWYESARLWVALVGTASASKSPAVSYAVDKLDKIDDIAQAQQMEGMRQYKKALAKWQKSKDEWEEAGSHGAEPAPPESKEFPRYFTKSATVEGFRSMIRYSHRGALICSDEIASFIGGMNQYKAGKGADRGDWLSAYNGGSMKIERADGTIFVKNWSASIVGGIQPARIAAFAKDSPDDGLLQRFWYAHAAENVVQVSLDKSVWQRVQVLETEYHAMIEHMCGMVSDGTVVQMDQEARLITKAFTDELDGYCRVGLYGEQMIAAVKKLYGGVHRLCLILHCIEAYRLNRFPTDIPCSTATAKTAVRFLQEFVIPSMWSFYTVIIHDGGAQMQLREVAEWILNHPHHAERISISLLSNAGPTFMRSATARDRRELLGSLTEYGWLLPHGLYRDSVTGMPKTYRVNPRVYEKYHTEAQQLSERLEAKREAMKKCGMFKWRGQ